MNRSLIEQTPARGAHPRASAADRFEAATRRCEESLGRPEDADLTRDELAAGLEDLATRARGQLTWGLRQLVVARDVRRSADGFASEDR